MLNVRIVVHGEFRNLEETVKSSFKILLQYLLDWNEGINVSSQTGQLDPWLRKPGTVATQPWRLVKISH
jgi:hypothetical protein